MEKAILELIEAIKALAPEVWSILIKQVYVDSASYLAWGVVVGLVSSYIWRVNVKLSIAPDDEYESDKDDRTWRASLCGALGTIGTLLTVGLFITGLGKLANPEFHAINYLLDRLGQ